MIPHTVNICGVPHNVILCEDHFNVDTHFGQIQYKDCEIRINRDMPEPMQRLTLMHEMVHGKEGERRKMKAYEILELLEAGTEVEIADEFSDVRVRGICLKNAINETLRLGEVKKICFVTNNGPLQIVINTVKNNKSKQIVEDIMAR